MLLISIIALVIIAGAVFYMYKSSKAVEVVLENKDLTDEIVEATASVSKSIKQVEKMTAKINEALASVPEKSSKEVKEDVTPELIVEETYEITEEEFQSEVAAGSTDVTSEEVGDSKPVRKKKRRYYPKKK